MEQYVGMVSSYLGSFLNIIKDVVIIAMLVEVVFLIRRFNKGGLKMKDFEVYMNTEVNKEKEVIK